MQKMKRSIFIFVFLLPTIVAFGMFYLYPILTVFYTSFCQWDYTNIANPTLWSSAELLNNYKYIFSTYPYFWEAVRNSVTWAFLGVFFQIPVATLMALGFSRKMKGIKLIRNIYIVPCMISSAAVGMIFLQIYNPTYGFINPLIKIFNSSFNDSILLLEGPAFWAMTGAYIFFTGTTTLLILGNIMAIPEEIREAALLDGSSGFSQDWHIVIPMIKGTLRTVSVLAATSGFLLYNEVYFLTKGAAGTYSISYIIRELAVNSPRAQYGRANTVAVIQVITGLIIIAAVNGIYGISFADLRRKLAKKGEKA
ncbi:MAG: sugar ABC transporter permease [Lachnospiraceae bacterium]|nr:sugar ABC transporter permease [Lachnospiraceae bacterium]